MQNQTRKTNKKSPITVLTGAQSGVGPYDALAFAAAVNQRDQVRELRTLSEKMVSLESLKA